MEQGEGGGDVSVQEGEELLQEKNEQEEGGSKLSVESLC